MKKNLFVFLTTVLLFASFGLSAQNVKVSGNVKEADGVGAVGAGVLIKGTTMGTVTDLDGNFTIDCKKGETLVISYLGFKDAEVVVDGSPIDVTLTSDNSLLDEVVVLGYGIATKKQDLSASVGVVASPETLAKHPVSSTTAMLQGQIPGVVVQNDGGSPTSGPSMVIRGQGSQNGDSVLWVVDGVPGAPINSMSDIESIVVLKDAASAAIYGAQSGAGGVVIVTTKRGKKGVSVSYDGLAGVRTATNLIHSCNAEEQARMRTIGSQNSGIGVESGWDPEINPWAATTRTDWVNEIFRNAAYHRHNVVLNAGTDNFKNRVSFKSDNNDGVLVGTYAKSIGIGGIATAGVIGIFKSWGVIRDAFKLFGQIFGKSGQATKVEASIERTQRDLSMKIIVFGTLLAIVATTIFFFIGPMEGNLIFTIVGILIVAVIAFLFTTVAANAIAIVGSNPVSGMTLMTLILSSIIMMLVGLNGTHGMVAALIMGGVVCTALSSAGSFITDLKIGYWLGSTPKYQETWKFVGVLVSAVTVGGVIMILNKAYGFTPDNSDVMAAPQARAMAAVIEPLMSGQGAPWLLYGIGAVIALILNFCKISPLAFALGMFIPFNLNIPLVVGGLINWYVGSRSTDAGLNTSRVEHGTLIASGFIAGGALMGVVSAALKFGGLDLMMNGWVSTNWAEWLSLVMYIVLIVWFVRSVLKRKVQK